jgi:Family of unknown function (DUF5343)
MASYIYTTNSAKIGKLLEVIQSSGVPPKLTFQHLEALGFKSKNDRVLLTIIKALGFASSTGQPTERWQQYRNKSQGATVLAQGVREHYSELFKTYPDAHLKDSEALHNFFSTHTTVAASTLKLMIMTFKALVGLADFDTEASTIAPVSSTTPPIAAATGSQTGGPQATGLNLKSQANGGVTININIELALPENATQETFNAFFSSMKKHLLG